MDNHIAAGSNYGQLGFGDVGAIEGTTSRLPQQTPNSVAAVHWLDCDSPPELPWVFLPNWLSKQESQPEPEQGFTGAVIHQDTDASMRSPSSHNGNSSHCRVFWVNMLSPRKGLKFASEDEAYRFYQDFAKKTGFKVRKGKVQKLSNKTVTKRYFVCSNEGYRSEKQRNKVTKFKRKETRTGCKAMIEITFQHEKWEITDFISEHHHVHQVPAQRHNDGSSSAISDAQMTNESLNEAMTTTEVNTAGFQGPGTKDYRKYVNGKGTPSLEAEDAKGLANCLSSMQVEDPSFFYAFQVDDNSRLTNIFWRFGSSLTDNNYRSDILILDTTCRVEKYNAICAVLLGLNRDLRYVLFGCAFLLDECSETYIWLLQKFQDAMLGRCQPKTVFTDECQTKADAVKLVFKETHHRIGTWFICQNARKHLPIYYGQTGFESLFGNWIYSCQTEEQFESSWNFLLEQYNLHENQWLRKLYNIQGKWCHLAAEKSLYMLSQGRESMEEMFPNLANGTMTLPKLVQHTCKLKKNCF